MTTTKMQIELNENEKFEIKDLLGLTSEDQVERMIFSAIRAADGVLVVKIALVFAEWEKNIQLVRERGSKNFRQVPSKADRVELRRMIAEGGYDPAEIDIQSFVRDRHRPGVSLDMADWEAGLREATIEARAMIIKRVKRIESFIWPERAPKQKQEAIAAE